MRTNPFILILLTALSALTACGEAAQTLRFVERADTDVVTDLGATGDSVGDILTFANQVFDEANSTEVGTDSGQCIRTAIGKTWECAWTLFLADGQITVAGPFFDTQDSVLAIIGGTKAYSGARGDMTLHARNQAGTEYEFTYWIGSVLPR